MATIATVRLGRPPVFSKSERRTVAKHMRRLGLTKGLKAAKKESRIKMSIPTAMKIAKDYGIEFQRGRPSNS